VIFILNYDFDKICNDLYEYCKDIGRVPSQKEIDNNINFLHHTTINKLFRQRTKTYYTYQEYCESLGYASQKYPFKNLNISDLYNLWEDFYSLNKRYPHSSDFNIENGLPTFTVICRILGNKKDEFFNHYKSIEDEKFDKIFAEECHRLKSYCVSINRVLGMRELTSHNFHTSSWFIKHSSSNINSYSAFIESIGLRPKQKISKECAIKLILGKYNAIGRALKLEDFCNIDSITEIGRPTIKRIWGTFNNMLKDLGLSINQKSMLDEHRDINTLRQDINNLCKNIYRQENRRIISLMDIDNSPNCLNKATYKKYFREYLNMTVSEYIESIGFISNKPGMGMVYHFADGEITVSQYEFNVSNYLRDNNIKYNRNIPYNKFISNYSGNKDCDYVINMNGKLYYIEIAGMLDYSRNSKDHKDYIRKKYECDLNQKISMLENAKLNYQIIYPKDFQSNSLDQLFSFLNLKTA
jgi:hypothetical protein